jgi:hypothetical protein
MEIQFNHDWGIATKRQNPPLTKSRGGFCLHKEKLGIELLSRGATPKVSSPLLRFTSEFGMGRCGSTTLLTPSMVHTEPSRLHSPRENNFFWSSPRSVSTPRLHPSLDFHLEPINGSSSRDLTGFCHESTHLEVGFPLRCFQRLSSPHLATLRLLLAQ